MKNSVDHFPLRTQEELNKIVELIRKYVKGCEMIILYGSYARGEHVLWDEKIEYGVHTSYQSDLDILVVLNKSNTLIADSTIRNSVVAEYDRTFSYRIYPMVAIIVERIDDLNENLEIGQYFFTEIINDGIILYNSNKCKLASPRDLSFKEIKDIALYEFNIHYPDGVGLLKYGKIALGDDMCRLGSFELHQACERFYNAITLVFKNYRPKNHKLKELGSQVKEFSDELRNVFPLDTEFEKRCFDLICRAYIEARYNHNFVVTKEEFVYLLKRVEMLGDITYRICQEQLAYYDCQIHDSCK